MSDNVRFDHSDFLYNRIICFLDSIKLTDGPDAVRGTIRRHPIIRDYIRHYQEQKVIDLEVAIDYNEDSEH